MVDILLATYNGEKYIEAQILSIISQSFKDWNLIIHDDGSTDRTVEIIKHYEEIDSRISLIVDDVHIGSAPQNFMHLLQYSKSDLIMFCDQDDIWFDNKVAIMVSVMKNQDNSHPVAAYCQMYLWKPQKGIIGIDGMIIEERNMNDFLFHNGGIHGCAACLNSCARDLMNNYKGHIAMHDHLLNFICLAFGKVIPVKIPLQLYRQHGQNVTGISKYALTFWERLLNSLSEKNPVVDKSHYLAFHDMYNFYHTQLEAKDRETLNAYLSMIDDNIVMKLYKIIKKGYRKRGSIFKLIIKTIIHPYYNR